MVTHFALFIIFVLTCWGTILGIRHAHTTTWFLIFSVSTVILAGYGFNQLITFSDVWATGYGQPVSLTLETACAGLLGCLRLGGWVRG